MGAGGVLTPVAEAVAVAVAEAVAETVGVGMTLGVPAGRSDGLTIWEITPKARNMPIPHSHFLLFDIFGLSVMTSLCASINSLGRAL